MSFDFSALSGTDFVLGAFGATIVEVYRLKRLLDRNNGQVKASKFQWSVNVIWFFLFVMSSGLLAAVQGVSPLLSAFYAGLTSPVFFSVILRDNAQAEKELIEKIEEPKDKEIAIQEAIISAKYREIEGQEEEIVALRTHISKLENALSFYSRKHHFHSNKIIGIADELMRERDSLKQVRKEPLATNSAEALNDTQKRIESVTSRLLDALMSSSREENPRLYDKVGVVNVPQTSGLEQMLQIVEESEANFENISKDKTKNRKSRRSTYIKGFISIGYFLVLIVMITVIRLLFPNGNIFINFALGLVMSILSNIVYSLANESDKLRNLMYRTF